MKNLMIGCLLSVVLFGCDPESAEHLGQWAKVQIDDMGFHDTTVLVVKARNCK